MKHTFYHIMLIVLFALCYNSITAQSYYPLKDGQTWKYNFIDYATSDTNRTNVDAMVSGKHNREVWSTTEVIFELRKDSVVNGKNYKVIVNKQNPFDVNLVREEGGNFFMLNNSTFKEENFLKTDVNVDDVWLDYENAEQTVATLYMVVAKEQTIQIKGKTYNNVIGIGKVTASVERIVTILQSDNPFIPVTYYAKGLGMIYSYLPYPLGGRYSDLEVSVRD
ncbi:MAG: hypothetical protein AB8G11_18110 [Saprospiraceae bacterium]